MNQPTHGFLPAAPGSVALESDDLVGPERPVRQLLEVRAASAVDDLLFSDGARVDAGAAESDPRTSLDRDREHTLEVVAAVGRLLPGERAGDGVAEEEDAHLFALAVGERVRESEPVA